MNKLPKSACATKSQPTKSWNNLSCKLYSNERKFGSWLKTFCKGFGLLLTYEIIEELIEEAIAYTITTVIAKAVSFLLIVILTQTVKVTAKGLAKGITIALKPMVKKLTYREGNDKVTKLLRFINMCKEKIKNNKFLTWLADNPKSISGIVCGLIASLASGAFTASGMYFGNVELPLWAVIVIGGVVFAILFAVVALGVAGAGFETPIKKALRTLAVKLGFGNAVVALDNTYQQFEAEEKAKAEAEQAEKEKRQATYLGMWKQACLSKTFEGSLEEFIEQKEAELAEEQARQEQAEKERALVKAKADWLSALSCSDYKGSFEEWQAEQQNK